MADVTIYDCKQAYARLDDFIDRELAEAEFEAVHRHLEICEHCTEVFEFEHEFVRRIKERVARVRVPDDLVSRLLAGIAD